MLRSTRDSRYFYIDWWLLNHCNYNCSYCPEILKNGSIDFPDLEYCEQFVDEAFKFSASQKKVCHYYFTGGEVTTWPKFIDLVKHIKKQQSYIRIRTNASMSVEQWPELIQYLDAINMEFHTEYTSQSHFLLCYNAAKKMGKSVGLTVSMLPDRWKELETMIEKIKNMYPDQHIHKKMLFEDPTKNQQPKSYSTEQKVKLKRQHGDLILTINGEEEFTDYNTLVLENKNVFTGRQCLAGLEQIIVDAWGRVARGHCRVGGHIGKLGHIFNWPNLPIECYASNCKNAFDITATKL